MQSRVRYADVLRVGATVAVVVLHTTVTQYEFNSVSRSWWWIGNVVGSFCLWCVPIFIMVSGMFLLNTAKDESAKVFFQKRFNRVIIPFIAWSIIYSFWKLRFDAYHGHFSYSVSGFVNDFLRGNVYAHLWFFYGLIPVYLVTPVLRIYVRKVSRRHLMYLLILWVLAMALYSAVNVLPNTASPRLTIANPLLMMAVWPVLFVGYFILGYFLNGAEIGTKQRRLIYFLAVSGLLVIISSTYFFTKNNNGVFQSYFYSYSNLAVIVMSAGIFLACKQIKWPNRLSQNRRASELLAHLTTASLGIYLVHLIVLDTLVALLGVLIIEYKLIHPAIAIPLASILTVAGSFIVVRLLQRIPVVKRIVS